jgi:CHAD domain-containing protein
MQRVAAAAADLQDLLGTMHDAVVTRADLEASSQESHDPEFAFASGRLVERLGASAREGRRGYSKAWRRVARRWRKA